MNKEIYTIKKLIESDLYENKMLAIKMLTADHVSVKAKLAGLRLIREVETFRSHPKTYITAYLEFMNAIKGYDLTRFNPVTKKLKIKNGL